MIESQFENDIEKNKTSRSDQMFIRCPLSSLRYGKSLFFFLVLGE